MRVIPSLVVSLSAAAIIAVVALSSGSPGSPAPRAEANAATGLGAGDYHSCALTEGGGVKCWGGNPYGELGEGRACGFTCAFAVSPSGLDSGVVQIAAGGYHTCAIQSGGNATCWGANISGQIGDGSEELFRPFPADVTDLNAPAAKIAAGYAHSCVLSESGGVQCWGDNWAGQLGDGSTTDSNVAIDVAGLAAGVIDVAAGGLHSCAALNTGGVKCWGYNSLGQLGDGTGEHRSEPVTVAGVANATQISVGESHTCALTSAGGVKCWGSNAEGQLGDGTTTDRSTPVDVLELTGGVAAISAGGYFTCALTDSGGVKCWGDNSWGQLGDVQACGEICPTFVDVGGLNSGVTTLATGLRHACAVASGEVQCWGADDTGKMATGDIHPNANPAPQAPIDIDIKAAITVTPPAFPTFTPIPTLAPGETPAPTPTPYGACGELPDVTTNGPRVGALTDQEAKIWVRACRSASFTLEYKNAGGDWETAQVSGPTPTDTAADNSAVFSLANLQSNTEYAYRLRVNGEEPVSPLEGRFRTLPPEGQEAVFSFVAGGDMHLPDFAMRTILDRVRQRDPYFAVLNGDNVLAEVFRVPPVSGPAYAAQYRTLLADNDVREFQANMATMMNWSDHEIYNDWDHRTSPPYPFARMAYDAYISSANPPPRNPDGVQYSFKAADIEFYVTDDRTFRSPNEKPDGPDKTMLGDVQKQDLKNWLVSSPARFKFIVSDVMWNDFAGHTPYGEPWAAFRTERNELFDFIDTNNIPGVVLLSGDEHWTGVFKMEPWGLYEIAPAPMSWVVTRAPTIQDPQILFRLDRTRVFGLFDVDTTVCPATLSVQIIDEANQPRYTVNLTERDLGADTDGNGLVPCEEEPGPSPTPTARPATPTPTPTGQLGDASCDGVINSIDAALILQRTAGLLANLPCPANADVNGDGRVDSIDASLVLQYAAGLLSSFS